MTSKTLHNKRPIDKVVNPLALQARGGDAPRGNTPDAEGRVRAYRAHSLDIPFVTEPPTNKPVGGSYTQNYLRNSTYSAPQTGPVPSVVRGVSDVSGGQGAEPPLACQYMNKSPFTDPKGRGKRRKRPKTPLKYVHACHDRRWTIRTWKKSDPSKVNHYKYRCGSWRHDGECRYRKNAQDFARIRAAIENEGVESAVYIVLTLDPKDWSDTYSEFKGLLRCWDLLRKRMQRKYGKIKYISVIEAHRSGRPHVNLIVFNDKLANACSGEGWKGVRKNWLEPNAVASGYGMRTWVEPVRGSGSMAGYLIKSMAAETAKPDQVPELAPKNFRRLRSSRRLLPKVYKSDDVTGQLVQKPIERAEAEWEKATPEEARLIQTCEGIKKPRSRLVGETNPLREHQFKKTKGVMECLE